MTERTWRNQPTVGPRPGAGWGPERRGNEDAGLAATAQKGREERGRGAPGVPASAAGWARDSRTSCWGQGRCHLSANTQQPQSCVAPLGLMDKRLSPAGPGRGAPQARCVQRPTGPAPRCCRRVGSLCGHSTGFTTTGSCPRCVATSPSLTEDSAAE